MFDIYFNSKRFLVVTLQTQAKHLFLRNKLLPALVIAKAAVQVPQLLQSDDNIYKNVNEINQQKASSDMKQKQASRDKEMKDII